MSSKTEYNNISYIFIPFRINDADVNGDFSDFCDCLEKTNDWEFINDKLHYLFRYVVSKLKDKKDHKTWNCVHYKLKTSIRAKYDLFDEDKLWSYKKTRADVICKDRFRILDVEIFCFQTMISILAIKIEYVSSNPFDIANDQYEMKKVGRAELIIDDDRRTTLLDIAKKIVREFKPGIRDSSFFFQSYKEKERANMLTLVEVGKDEDSKSDLPMSKLYSKELYFLRNCYSQNYRMLSDDEVDRRETMEIHDDVVWGISSEAAVCLANIRRGRENFIKGAFNTNFQKQYMYMYVFLLHQKYAIYNFLMMLEGKESNSLDTLESYRSKLIEFERDYTFTCVTEVPEYQKLYTNIVDIFELKDMYSDVREPLFELQAIKEAEVERHKDENDEKLNTALTALTILAVFSALTDSFDSVEKFLTLFKDIYLGNASINDIVVMGQLICFALITIVLLYILISLLRRGKHDRGKN